MTKTKGKIIIFVILATIGLTVGFFFSGLVNLALSGSFREATQLAPNEIIKSLLESERHRLLLLCVEVIIVSGISVVFLMNRRDTFESEVSNVAGSLNTPNAIGQGQHGTARWLKKEEQPKVFSRYWLDTGETLMDGLLKAGDMNRKEVKKYSEEISKMERATANQNPDSEADATNAEKLAKKPPDGK